MNDQLHGLEHCTRVYLDDVIVHSRDVATHLRDLRAVLCRVRTRRLALKGKKCTFMRQQLLYLGHVVSATGITPDPAKVSAVADLPAPTDVHKVRSFLGCTNY